MVFLKKAWKSFVRRIRPPRLVNIGDFWCEKHFNYIVASQATNNPIDYHIATMGVGRFINLYNDYEVDGPLRNACERIPKEVLEGIFERSRGWI